MSMAGDTGLDDSITQVGGASRRDVLVTGLAIMVAPLAGAVTARAASPGIAARALAAGTGVSSAAVSATGSAGAPPCPEDLYFW